MDTALISDDYDTARRRFRDAAAALSCSLETHGIEQKGPSQEPLSIDVAMSANNQHGPVVVLSSGVHGVEGYFGSAVQLGLLKRWAARPDRAPKVRWVMLHALNPYGFAWRRRVNEDNVDLNRNFLLQGEPFTGSPKGYAELDGLLNPPRTPSRWEPVGLKFISVIARHGMPALKQAVASGQYDYPRGLFYGGSQPSRATEILNAHFNRWLADSTGIVHLDIHTGLGKWGTYKLLVGQRLSQAQRQWLTRWIGPDSYELLDARGVSYATRGSLGGWGYSKAGPRDYLYAAAEFGTYPERRVLAALRAENQCHHWGKPDEAITRLAKERLVEAFCPRSEQWRTQSLEQAFQLVERAITGLAGRQLSAVTEM